MKIKADQYDEIGERFDRNNAAVGKIFEKYTNASQVVRKIVNNLKQKAITPSEMAMRMRA
ncbi:MAG: hypothetical protein QXS81_01070 [Candidatus Micrarchaeaceae archaeon]